MGNKILLFQKKYSIDVLKKLNINKRGGKARENIDSSQEQPKRAEQYYALVQDCESAICFIPAFASFTEG